MTITLPLVVRAAVGLAASGVDHLSKLPEELPTLTVTIAGQAMRLTMRVRQHVADLATRGDEVLGRFGAEPVEHPDWARFDEEETPPPEVTDLVRAPIVDEDPADPDPADEDAATDDAAGDDDPPGPAALPGYPSMSLAELRGHLRHLSAPEVTQLLEFEQAGAGRAPFLTLLGNRLTTLEHTGQ